MSEYQTFSFLELFPYLESPFYEKKGDLAAVSVIDNAVGIKETVDKNAGIQFKADTRIIGLMELLGGSYLRYYDALSFQVYVTWDNINRRYEDFIDLFKIGNIIVGFKIDYDNKQIWDRIIDIKTSEIQTRFAFYTTDITGFGYRLNYDLITKTLTSSRGISIETTNNNFLKFITFYSTLNNGILYGELNDDTPIGTRLRDSFKVFTEKLKMAPGKLHPEITYDTKRTIIFDKNPEFDTKRIINLDTDVLFDTERVIVEKLDFRKRVEKRLEGVDTGYIDNQGYKILNKDRLIFKIKKPNDIYSIYNIENTDMFIDEIEEIIEIECVVLYDHINDIYYIQQRLDPTSFIKIPRIYFNSSANREYVAKFYTRVNINTEPEDIEEEIRVKIERYNYITRLDNDDFYDYIYRLFMYNQLEIQYDEIEELNEYHKITPNFFVNIRYDQNWNLVKSFKDFIKIFGINRLQIEKAILKHRVQTKYKDMNGFTIFDKDVLRVYDDIFEKGYDDIVLEFDNGILTYKLYTTYLDDNNESKDYIKRLKRMIENNDTNKINNVEIITFKTKEELRFREKFINLDDHTFIYYLKNNYTDAELKALFRSELTFFYRDFIEGAVDGPDSKVLNQDIISGEITTVIQ